MGQSRRRRRRFFLLVGVFLIAGTFGATAGLVAGILSTAPSLDEVVFNPSLTTYIYDIHGREIARLYRGENRIPVSLEEIPKHLRDAVVAIEDHEFYNHYGISIRGLLRALIVNIREGRWGDGNWAQGGGTITGQLARNAFLTLERTVSRKIKEWIWAIQIERKYTKNEILETYLNEVYFGHSAYGVEAASRLFFGKSVSELDLAESALLAGVLNSPGLYSPLINIDNAYRRRNLVLDRMAELGYITEAEAEAAKAQPINLVESQPPRNSAPYFVDYILQTYLLPTFGDQAVYAGGLRVYTTLDLDAQRAAEASLLAFLPAGEPDARGLHQPQGAIVSIDPRTGEIRAMVGGRGEDHFNRAVQAVRSPGSAIKPIVYALAIERGLITPGTIMLDEPIEVPLVNGQVYTPRNFGLTYRGPITVRRALEVSSNVVAVQVLLSIPGQAASVIEFARSMGITTLVSEGAVNDHGPAFALGGLTRGVTPLELAAAYATFANQGIYTEPIAVLRVESYDGTVLDEPRPKQWIVMSEETAYLMADMLRGVIEAPGGTGSNARLGDRPAAGKTGTSQDNHNAWFVGFTPELVTAVWIGNDIPATLPFGSGRAAQVFGDYMRTVLADTPPSWFDRPSGIVTVRIDVQTGGRVPDGCELVPVADRRTEFFIAGTEPLAVSERCFDRPADPPESPFFALPESPGASDPGTDGAGNVETPGSPPSPALPNDSGLSLMQRLFGISTRRPRRYSSTTVTP